MSKTRPLLFILALLSLGCGPNEGVLRSGKETPASTPAETTVEPFERELADVKEANLPYLYIVRRRDGGILTSEDKAFVRKQTVEADRRVLADGDRAVIISSKYTVIVQGVEKLKTRFEVTDLSQPPSP